MTKVFRDGLNQLIISGLFTESLSVMDDSIMTLVNNRDDQGDCLPLSTTKRRGPVMKHLKHICRSLQRAWFDAKELKDAGNKTELFFESLIEVFDLSFGLAFVNCLNPRRTKPPSWHKF
jgi:hypothetical protein